MSLVYHAFVHLSRRLSEFLENSQPGGTSETLLSRRRADDDASLP